MDCFVRHPSCAHLTFSASSDKRRQVIRIVVVVVVVAFSNKGPAMSNAIRRVVL
jgi:hypothetical protein